MLIVLMLLEMRVWVHLETEIGLPMVIERGIRLVVFVGQHHWLLFVWFARGEAW